MKNKHLQIQEDNQLLKDIYDKINQDPSFKKQKHYWYNGLKLLLYCCAVITAYLLLFHLQNTLLFFTCIVFYGITCVLITFNYSHELSHNNVFKSKKWNNWLYTLTFTMVGAHAEAWKLRHVDSHHFAPNVQDYDPDLKITKIIRVLPNSEHFWYHRFQHFYAPFAYTTYSLFWVLIKDFVILYAGKNKKPVLYHVSFWLQKSFYFTYLLILPILFSYQPWYIVLLGFLFMHLFQSLFLLFTFFMTHHVEKTEYPTTNHDGIINTSWAMNQIKSSNDMNPFCRVTNFILGGFNNHIAHHLFPHIHHVHYPKLSKIIYQKLEERGIVANRTSYFGGVVSHLRLLNRMAKAR